MRFLMIFFMMACSSGSSSGSNSSVDEATDEDFFTFHYLENDSLVVSGSEGILNLSQKKSVVISFKDYVHIYIKLDFVNLDNPINTVTHPLESNFAYANPLTCLDGVFRRCCASSV